MRRERMHMHATDCLRFAVPGDSLLHLHITLKVLMTPKGDVDLF